MSLTITIPGAVETTTGSTAPAVLTVGVGAAGQGVPSGGTTGQVLQKLSGVSYDTGWLTLPANYITSVTAPLAVTAGNLAVDLSAYLTSATAASTYQTLAGMSSYLTTATAASTYYLQTNPDGFLQSTTAASTYQTQAGMVSYATLGGSTFTGLVQVKASNGAGAGLLIPLGSTPSAPVDGEIWNAGSAGLKARLASVTETLANQSWVTSLGYATLASPTFTGTPTLPTGTIATTQAALDSSTKLATTAFVTTADNLKANLASPTFTGTPLSTTAAVDTNTTQIATTAYVVGQGYAKLASPTFTGTPTLPTGTIATTQSPGNNTTALATTAFVTAAVPAFASILNTSKQTSTTTAQNPASLLGITFSDKGVLVPMSSAFATATSGAGASASLYYGALLASTPVSVAGYAGAYYATGTHYNGLTNRDIVDWTKTVGFSCVTNRESTAFPSGVLIRITLGKSASGGTLVTRGIGLEIISGQTYVKILTHDGTTLTTTNSTYPLATNLTSNYVHQMSVISYGNGTAELFVDGVSYGTASGAPTTASTGTQNRYSIETYADGTQGATPLSQLFAHNKIITSL